jgi:hypothetical protein
VKSGLKARGSAVLRIQLADDRALASVVKLRKELLGRLAEAHERISELEHEFRNYRQPGLPFAAPVTS